MDMFGKELLLGGVAFMAFAQVLAAMIAFRVGFAEGMCSLVVPGYLLVAMRRFGYYWKFVAVWGTGIVAIVIGTLVLSQWQ
jgi:hypothetical protein